MSDPKELVDENDPLALAQLLVESVDEDNEPSPTVWLLKAIAIAQIDLAQTARDSLANAIKRDAEMMSAMATNTSLMGKVADNDDLRTQAAMSPSLQMGPFNFPIPLDAASESSEAVNELCPPAPTALCVCSHQSRTHVQGDGHCLVGICECREFEAP